MFKQITQAQIVFFPGNSDLVEWYEFMNQIVQKGELEFHFSGYYQNEVLDWLINDCYWNYDFHTPIYGRMPTVYGRKSHLKFADIRSAVEFKLRFM